MTDIHTCSYYCDRPECIKAQRDELRRMFVETPSEAVSSGFKSVPYVATPEMLDAAIDAFDGFNGEDEVDSVWNAMLTASPEKDN